MVASARCLGNAGAMMDPRPEMSSHKARVRQVEVGMG